MTELVYKTFSAIGSFLHSNLDFIYLFLIATVLHFIAANAYANWCAPQTIVGFLMSPFMTVTPVCSALRWSITLFGDYLASIWTLGFLWVSTNLVKRFCKKDERI
jgi:hypothetical protein